MTELPVIQDKRGFTLIEFLVSIVILMVGLLGLLQTVNMSYSSNLQNQLRNEAVVVTDLEMAKEFAKGYEGVDPSQASVFRTYTVSRKILSSFKLYSVAKTGTQLQNSKQVMIETSWKYKKIRYSHNASGVISKAIQ